MDPFVAPATFFALFSFVMVTMIGLIVWFVKSVTKQQERMGLALEKSSDSLVAIMTKVDLVADKLLDAVIVLAKSTARQEVKEIVKAAAEVPEKVAKALNE